MDPIPAPPEASEPVPPPEPVRSTSAGGEDVLGLRIAAALIDLALLLVLNVVLGATIGEANVEGGEFSFVLTGSEAALFLVLVFFYYFALEAIIGRTVGKLLLGMRVVGRNGGPPSLWAVGIRTVLRVVDWLPLLYLVGFVAMLATGDRRRRLGDLGAKTSVARALPIRRRGLAAALLASCLVLALVASVVSVAGSGEEDRDSTYRAHGVSFEYPAGWWDITDEITFGVEEGGANELWVAGFSVGDLDIISVTAYRMTMPITAENLDANKAEVTLLVRQLFESQRGAMHDGPDEITMAGMPGLRYRGDGLTDGTPIDVILILAFDGTTEYLVNCQLTQGSSTEIERDCEQVVRTFKVD
jgi:uncharacterized RDD family membrane protein YckC